MTAATPGQRLVRSPDSGRAPSEPGPVTRQAARHEGRATTGETVTLIRARGRRLAKRVHPDGTVEGYDRARLFDLAEHPLADLAALADLLRRLLPRRDTAVVRGAILDPARARCVRRLLLSDRKTGGVPTLREVPRRWLALDMENIPLPASVPAADLEGCYRIALATLPAAFHGRACIVQASGSHGFTPGLRLHLWFWLDRPLSGAELKRWLGHTPMDRSVLGAVQPIYTAAPVMADGAPDPLPRRLVVIPGAALVRTPPPEALAPPLPRPRGDVRLRVATRGRTTAYVRNALIRAAGNIISAGKRHPVIVRECARLARLVHAGLLTEGELRAVITGAAARAGKEDAREIDSCVAWGLAHPSAGRLPEPRDER